MEIRKERSGRINEGDCNQCDYLSCTLQLASTGKDLITFAIHQFVHQSGIFKTISCLGTYTYSQ
eukprot:754723-Hanusia_phi.AAC.1